METKTIIHAVLPTAIRPRRLYFGHARGAVANIDFRVDAGFYFGRHEPELRQYYNTILKPGMRSFDVGAYRGWEALAFAHRTKADVVSFDTNTDCIGWA